MCGVEVAVGKYRHIRFNYFMEVRFTRRLHQYSYMKLWENLFDLFCLNLNLYNCVSELPLMNAHPIHFLIIILKQKCFETLEKIPVEFRYIYCVEHIWIVWIETYFTLDDCKIITYLPILLQFFGLRQGLSVWDVKCHKIIFKDT